MLENPFLYSIAMTLVHFLWQGLLVACVLKLFYLFISNKNSQLRYGLAAVAMLANLLLPIATFALIYQTDFALLSQNKESISTIVTSITRVSSAEFSENIAEYFPYIAILWLLVVSYLSLKLLYDIRYVSHLTKKGVYAPQDQLNKRFNELALQLKLIVMPRLLISAKAEIPMAVGWLKPVVLLPASMLSGLTPAQLEMLLLHELAHIKRHDYLVNFMQTLVEILLFFHPAVHWVSTQMRNEREYCSDDIAVQHCCQPVAYARALTETAALCQKHNHSIPQMALAASGGDLKQRVIRLVDSHCTANNDMSKWFAGLFIITSLLAISSKELLSVSTFERSFSYLPFYTSNTDTSTSLPSLQQTQNLTKSSIAKHLLNNEIQQVTTPFTPKTTKIATSSANKINAIATQKSTTKPSENNTLVAFSRSQTSNDKKSSKMNNNSKQLANKNNNYQILPSPTGMHKPVVTTPKNQSLGNKKQLKPALQTHVLTQYKSPKNTYAQEIAALANEQPYKTDSAKLLSEKSTYAPTQLNDKKAALLIASYPPKYPSIAKRNKVELEVLVHFTIDTHGFVRNIEFEQSGKVNYFKRAIRNAMKKWRFEPATINGNAVESQMSKIFSFSLEG